MILSGLVSENLLLQETAVIKIDFDHKIGEVDPEIYSAFVEPIRTVVYRRNQMGADEYVKFKGNTINSGFLAHSSTQPLIPFK
jgi:hypothetical protein